MTRTYEFKTTKALKKELNIYLKYGYTIINSIQDIHYLLTNSTQDELITLMIKY